MKKTSLGILTAALAFFCGFFTVHVVHFGQSLTQSVEIPFHSEVEETLLPIQSEPKTEDAHFSAEDENYVITPSGYYYSEKEDAADFYKNATIINLSVHFEDGKQIVVSSIYDAKTGEVYEQAAAMVSEKTFNLQTMKSKGVEYKFEGTFIKNGFRKEFEYGEKVLKGKLQKFINSKKVKEIKSRFIFEYETCGVEKEDN